MLGSLSFQAKKSEDKKERQLIDRLFDQHASSNSMCLFSDAFYVYLFHHLISLIYKSNIPIAPME